MNKHIAERWVQALKSGKYPQTDGGLRDGHGYCCLGVLCDLYREEQGKGQWEDYLFVCGKGPTNVNDLVLPGPVQEWAGMKSSVGDLDGVIGHFGCASLAELNDCGTEFPDIAETIENKWEVL